MESNNVHFRTPETQSHKTNQEVSKSTGDGVAKELAADPVGPAAVLRIRIKDDWLPLLTKREEFQLVRGEKGA
jgi:hypothetical protein